MRIEFRRAGGYANLPLVYRADTAELPKERADEIARLVREGGIFELDAAAVPVGGGGPPDAFSYRLVVEAGPRHVSLAFTDATAPPAVRPLLVLLQRLAIDHGRRGGLGPSKGTPRGS